MIKFQTDFYELPSSLIYSFHDPDGQISTVNQLISYCI